MRLIFVSPVVEVVNVDHEGEVGEGSQHEGGDEAGGDVVTGLPHKVHHHLETLLWDTITQNYNLFGVPISSCINNGVVVDKEFHHRLCALVDDVSRFNKDLEDKKCILQCLFSSNTDDLSLDGVPHLELKLTVLLVEREHAKVVVAREIGKPPIKQQNEA